MIEVVLNGEARLVPEGLSLRELLQHAGIQEDRVAVELDRSIVRRTDWENTAIEPGARLEIVQFVGGG